MNTPRKPQKPFLIVDFSIEPLPQLSGLMVHSVVNEHDINYPSNANVRESFCESLDLSRRPAEESCRSCASAAKVLLKSKHQIWGTRKRKSFGPV